MIAVEIRLGMTWIYFSELSYNDGDNLRNGHYGAQSEQHEKAAQHFKGICPGCWPSGLDDS